MDFGGDGVSEGLVGTGPMLPYGIAVDISGTKAVADAMSVVAGGLAAAYADFGSVTVVPQGWLVAPEDQLGTMDPAGEAPAPDVPDAWSHFCAAWGDFMDAAGATVSALSAKLSQTAAVYTTADGKAVDDVDAAKVLQPYTLGPTGQRLAYLTTLVPPPATSPPQQAQSRWASLTTKAQPPGAAPPATAPPATGGPTGQG